MRVLWLLILALCYNPALAQGRDWKSVSSFAYQLQKLDLKSAADSPYDLLICDYSLQGDEETRLTSEQVKALQRGPNGKRRYLLAYLSIGEAEEYRFYWKERFKPGEPSWLGEPNPQWPDNSPVHYWDPAWKAIVFSYLDKILEVGFDGVYLDRVDAFEMYPKREGAMAEMSQFVQEISVYARERAGQDFGVFPQNGHELLQEPGYLQAITGIGREDTYFGYPQDAQASPEAWTQEVESWLKKATDAGKLVLNVDYTDDPEQAALAKRLAKDNGYLEYVAGRELANLELDLNRPERKSRPSLWLLLALGLAPLTLALWRKRRR